MNTETLLVGLVSGSDQYNENKLRYVNNITDHMVSGTSKLFIQYRYIEGLSYADISNRLNCTPDFAAERLDKKAIKDFQAAVNRLESY